MAADYAGGETVSLSVAGPHAYTFTEFYGAGAARKAEKCLTLPALRDMVLRTSRPEKAALPWLKFATFGEALTEKKSFRHDANVIEVTGLEADYDGEVVHVSEAVEKLTKAGVLAFVYTSPSHAAGKPRWRVVCPFSQPYPPEKRAAFLGRLNGLLGGILAGESWTLSQSYFYGSVGKNPAHTAEIVEGEHIDQLDELDEIWLGKPNTGIAKVGGSGQMQSGPVDQVALLQEIEDGKSYHTAMMRLLGVWALNDGVPMVEAKRRILNAMEMTFPPDRDQRWDERRVDLDRCIQYVYGKQDAKPVTKDEKQKQEPSAVWSFICPTSLDRKPVPERQFIVDGWLAAATVTINYGDGGVGKTLLAQQLMTSCATGLPWCGLAVTRCPSLALFCEDDEDELHRRQHAINLAYGIDFDQLADMTWVSGVGHDNTLAEFDGDGRLMKTSALLTFEKQAKATGAKLLVIDTAADTFGGNEIIRRQVRQFVGHALGGLAKDTGAAVLLNAHPSRTGMSKDGDMDGGSTAWSNTARSRWSLARPKAEGDDQADTNERILTRRKANYASIGDTIKLRWQSGVLMPSGGLTGLPALAGQADADCTFLTLLDRCEGSSIRVAHGKTSGNYAPKVFAARPDRNGHNRKAFEDAMQRLLAAGTIKLIAYGRKGDDRQRVGRVGWEGCG